MNFFKTIVKRFRLIFNLDVISENVIYLTLGIVILSLYLITFPENRTEADDGYWFAYAVRDLPYYKLLNPRFALFLPFAVVVDPAGGQARLPGHFKEQVQPAE